MSYVKAEGILPRELLEQIQEYAEGLYLYIPKKHDHHKGWGTNTDSRNEIRLRDSEIYGKYSTGSGITELAGQYFLSEKSIQRILLQERKKRSNV